MEALGFILWITGIVVAAVIAKNRNSGQGGAIFLSILLTPIVGILYAALSKPAVKRVSQMTEAEKLKKLKDLKFMLEEGVITIETYEARKLSMFPN